jgi:hypothetical protein
MPLEIFEMTTRTEVRAGRKGAIEVTEQVAVMYDPEVGVQEAVAPGGTIMYPRRPFVFDGRTPPVEVPPKKTPLEAKAEYDKITAEIGAAYANAEKAQAQAEEDYKAEQAAKTSKKKAVK